MKFQWSLIVGLIFAILIAIFAVLNVEPVRVNYLFGTAQIPLILVILGTALLGAVVSGLVSAFRSVQWNRKVSDMQKEMTAKEITIASQQNELAEIKDKTPAEIRQSAEKKEI